MILMYHKVHPESPTLWWVTVDAFYRQLHALRNRRVVYLDDYDPADPNQVVISFDGIYRNVLEYAAPLLNKFAYPFELFVTSDYIGHGNDFDGGEPSAEFASLDELSALVRMGGRLQWHSRSHCNLKDIQDSDTIEAELTVPDELKSLDPHGFQWFAYPHGDFNDAVLAATRQRFRGGVSCIQGNEHDHHCLNRVTATNTTRLRQSRISVVIASYNYGRFLVEAIESVLRQTIPADEILISDDCSGDETWEIARDYEARYPALIRTNRNERNLGIVAHFNKAVRLTTGEYVCILGADNRFRSDFLEATTALLDTDERTAIAYTDFALFGSRATVVAAELGKTWPVRCIADHFHVVSFPDFTPAAREIMAYRNFMHGSSLFRREAFEAVGGYQEMPRLPEDYALFRRILDAGWNAGHIAQPLLEYRQHSRDQANIQATSAALLHHYRKRHEQDQRVIAELQSCIAQTRRSFAWKLAMPVRVAENLLRRWLKE